MYNVQVVGPRPEVRYEVLVPGTCRKATRLFPHHIHNPQSTSTHSGNSEHTNHSHVKQLCQYSISSFHNCGLDRPRPTKKIGFDTKSDRTTCNRIFRSLVIPVHSLLVFSSRKDPHRQLVVKRVLTSAEVPECRVYQLWITKNLQPMIYAEANAGAMPSEMTPLTSYPLPPTASTSRTTFDLLNSDHESNERYAESIDVEVTPPTDDHAGSSSYNPMNSTCIRILPAILILASSFLYMLSTSSSSLSIPPATNQLPIVGEIEYTHPKPFSKLDPIYDLHLYGFDRNADTSPPRNIYRPNADAAVPTNEWYQNLLMNHAETTELQRVYAVPYMVDLAGPIPGLQIHPNHIDASSNVIQLSYVIPHGLTLGAAENSKHATRINSMTNEFSVLQMTPLGITLTWVRFNNKWCPFSYFCP